MGLGWAFLKKNFPASQVLVKKILQKLVNEKNTLHHIKKCCCSKKNPASVLYQNFFLHTGTRKKNSCSPKKPMDLHAKRI